MGKKSRKTRWRTLTLNGHQSDSEESSSKSSLQASKGYQHKYSKFPYSSQSTPIRKFQHESSKSTRSNSTTSEHKATFNEDEYTRITTPRQDVLFKKGYLNKPKSYQTQTSTGTSSTANSTSTCTPDHQSAEGTEGTDLEYESQFVFPNGFIDQNGIYYINSFEPFPLVVYNASICYPEYPSSKSKRYSTESLTESTSPQNEEASQEPVQNGTGECLSNTPVFNQSYVQPPTYCYNGICTLTNGQYTTDDAKKVKKRRRRKISRSKSSVQGDATSEDTDGCDSLDEVFSPSEDNVENKPFDHKKQPSVLQQTLPLILTNGELIGERSEVQEEPQPGSDLKNETQNFVQPATTQNNEEQTAAPISSIDAQNMLLQSLLKGSEKRTEEESETSEPNSIPESTNITYSLKPDAEEFIPRTLRPPEALPFDPNIHFLNIPSNFFPIPFVSHLGDVQQPHFLTPGISVNFMPAQDPKIIPNYINLVPNGSFMPSKTYTEGYPALESSKPPEANAGQEKKSTNESENATQIENQPIKKTPRNDIDIARIVSKLEEAAKQQRFFENKRRSSTNKYNVAKPFPPQRMRFAHKYTQENGQLYVPSKYHQRSLDKHQNDKRFRSQKSKQNLISDAEVKKAYFNESASKVIEDGITDPDKDLIGGTKVDDQNVVNNVNNSTSENCSMTKDFKLENNYSDKLKKKLDSVKNITKSLGYNSRCPRFEKHAIQKVAQTQPQQSFSKVQRAQNQWIAVSSRKKRKNKPSQGLNSVDEQGHEEEEALNDDHLFESFDVDLLEDVVLLPKLEEKITPKLEVMEEALMVTTNGDVKIRGECSKSDEVDLPPLKVATVIKTEKRKKTKKTHKNNTKRVIITDADLEIIKPKEDSEPVKSIVEEKAETCCDDFHLPQNQQPYETVQTAKEVQLDEPLSNDAIIIPETQNENIKSEEQTSTTITLENLSSNSNDHNEELINEVVLVGIPDQKNKKKKKKPLKSLAPLPKTQSTSSSNTTLNILDDSYEFLLENSILEEFEQKTNVEISQELDRIIQKGMYNSLEEKIRAMNINAVDDDFFKAIYWSSTNSKTNDATNMSSSFGKVLKNTTQLLKFVKTNNKITQQQNTIDLQFCNITLPNIDPQPSTSKSGIFLENPEMTEFVSSDFVTLSQDLNKPKNDEKTKSKRKREDILQVEGEEGRIEQESKNLTTTSTTFSFRRPKQDKFYPITQAVKEWMTRTRENTPDVEILKSPNTIYKEFCETELEKTKQILGNPRSAEFISRESSPISHRAVNATEARSGCEPAGEITHDDEITIWSALSKQNMDEDLLDCWEDEIGQKGNLSKCNNLPNYNVKEIKGTAQSVAHLNGHVEEGEEALEIYESKYGKNEDFLQLRAEIAEQQRSLNFPRHGNLPYRAICCSIM